jgi:hypothetical protein
MGEIVQFDKTKKDLNRRDINLHTYDIKEAMPQYIVEKYPKLVNLLEEYYGFENENESPSKLIDNLFETRDITQTDLDLLSYIEDEYLLGQNYFQGFEDKRASAKYSNTLYRSKGTKYSISQFFRTFFGIEPDIVYTKEQVFTVGTDKIGPDSQRYLTNDKLYQKYAILIKSELSLDKWRESYKLLAHPAGMYLGANLQIVGTAELDDLQYDPGKIDIPPNEVEGAGGFTIGASAQHSGLIDVYTTNGSTSRFRVKLGHNTLDPAGDTLLDHSDRTIGDIDNLYSSVAELLTVNSPTLDDDNYVYADSDDTRAEFDIPRAGRGLDLSSEERVDQDVWVLNPSIDRTDPFNRDSDGYGNLWTGIEVGDSDSEITLEELLKHHNNPRNDL